jgi:two-component system sensor histidine kinase KdpD
MLPLRSHLSVATTALVLVVPVVAGVAIGGFPVGVVAVAAGFLAYDYVFIPPYYTLSVGAAQNWTALGVYVVVVLLVARVVASLQVARTEARRKEDDTRRLFELSELLIGDKPLGELLEAVVRSVRAVFRLEGAALLLPVGGRLELVAADGPPLPAEALRRVVPSRGAAAALSAAFGPRRLRSVTLAAAGRPVGLLVLEGAPLSPHDRALLGTFANHAALAIEQAQLRDQAVRAEALEEVDRWRRALVGTVSHDLRTPLASIKAAVSDLRDPSVLLGEEDRTALLETIEAQADHLARLVTNLLDMSRIEAGALELRRQASSLADLVEEALAALGPWIGPERVRQKIPPDLPLVDVDHVLVAQVLANLLENAARHAPEGSEILVTDSSSGGIVEVAVADEGPGVPWEERERVFQMFHRRAGGGRAGLGLSIAKAFVEAHGGTIRMEEAPAGGARVVFSLPACAEVPLAAGDG